MANHQYIVIDGDNNPMSLGSYSDTPKTGVLVNHGRQATVFDTDSKARYAIDRTRVYAERNKLGWGVRRFRVLRLVPASNFVNPYA